MNQFRALQLENIGKVAKWPKLPILNCFGPLQLENIGKLETAKIGHSESIWITSVGKYWKSCKMSKIGHPESIWITSIGKY